MSQKIRVLYFAAVRDITNTESDELEIEGQYTLSNLSEHLVSKYGEKIQEILLASMYAVNMEYIPKDMESVTALTDNSEVAIIPPVSGG
ncbi:hypothetical protein BY458DRAFT_555250 [Sporodiniella umbellata]|nr:hypothetical protein BY458DRAFT_555250 [Sporodiniella umbellata]